MEPSIFKNKVKEPMSNTHVVVAITTIIEPLFKVVDKGAN